MGEQYSRLQKNQKLYDEVYESDNFKKNDSLEYQIKKEVKPVTTRSKEVFNRSNFQESKDFKRFFEEAEKDLKSIEEQLELTSVNDLEAVNKTLQDVIYKAKKTRGLDPESKNTQYNILSNLNLNSSDERLSSSELKVKEVVSLKSGISELESLIRDIDSHTKAHRITDIFPTVKEEPLAEVTKDVEDLSSMVEQFKMDDFTTREQLVYEDSVVSEKVKDDETFIQKNEKMIQVLFIILLVISVVIITWFTKDLFFE